MNDKPVRIQRKRTKGWRMPPNAVYVGRPTKWGNPFGLGYAPPLDTREAVVNLYRQWILDDRSLSARQLRAALGQLRGKDLACWCSTDCACHADVLLELANATEVEPALN